MNDIINELAFFFQRLNWLSVVDLLLVTVIAFFLLKLLQGTQAAVLLRGLILLIIISTLLTILRGLPAFSWLLQTSLPALLIAIPVIFAPEIRRALERLGRASSLFSRRSEPDQIENMIDIISQSTKRLSDRRYGALIVIEREVQLDEYVETGIHLDAILSPALILQIFFINTPLHDGAVILRGERIIASSCVMPLSASGTLSRTPDHQMGLRHRAALGISEVSDSVTVVVSEETGDISVAHNGRLIRLLDQNRLHSILASFFHRRKAGRLPSWLVRPPFRRKKTEGPTPVE